MPDVRPVTDDPAEAIYQHITGRDALPAAWNDGKWCSAAVCRSVTLSAVSKKKLCGNAILNSKMAPLLLLYGIFK